MTRLASHALPEGLSSIAVIMAGGSGTRFWPLSRASYPKQFLRLTSDSPSLLQTTARRLEPLVSSGGISVVTAASMVPLVREHIPNAAVLAEPLPRNTAACVGYAATWVLAEVGDIPMVCVPADHLIRGEEGLLRVLRHGIQLAEAGNLLVTIGIVPTHAETGYGYIQRGELHTTDSTAASLAYRVKRFVEKPDVAKARVYLESGDYLWNSGMFIWRPSVILEAISHYLPELRRGLEAIRPLVEHGGTVEEAQELFARLPSISIDRGVMERAGNALVLPATGFYWSDVGSWDAWVDCIQNKTDDRHNFGGDETLFVDSNRVAILGNKKLIAVVGVSDLIVVDTDDALLICHRSEAQGVKKVVDLLKQRGRSELL